MKGIFEIIFYGRGGQGVKTASQMIADSLIRDGYYIQSFPEYGPERSGAPVRAYNRISKKPITIHCSIEQADMVVVVDPTLLGNVNVSEKLSKDGILIVNYPGTVEELKKQMGLKPGVKVHVVDATKISKEVLGKDMPNIPILGAMSKYYSEIKLSAIKEEIKHKFSGKLGEVMVKKNFDSLDRGLNEVK